MNRLARTALPGVIVCALSVTMGQQGFALEPANVSFGPMFITPTLEVEQYYTDNLWLTEDDKKDTWATILTPKVQAWIESGPSEYSLGFEIEDSHYHSSGDDDYTDYTTNLDIKQVFTARNTLDLFAEYYDGHEERGSGFIQGNLSLITDGPVEYQRTTYGGDYIYGSKESRGRIRLGYKSADYDYDNFREFTRFFDREEETLNATLFWKIAPRTDALIEVRAIDNDYVRVNPDDPAGSLSNDEYNYLVGVDWEATAKTTGHVKVGAYDRDYDSNGRQDEDGFLWDVGVLWEPRSFTSLDFNTRRFYQPTNGIGNGINTRVVELTWLYDLSGRSSTHLSAGFESDDYEGSDREDDIYGIEAKYIYAFRRWFDLGAGYRFEDRDSNVNVFNYDENVWFIEAKLSL
ncbi:MAG: outer membrane beta-barrel protein [Pseudomonadota bacterium]